MFNAHGRGGHVTQALGVLLLAPICAEYLAAYTDSTGDPGELLLGLLIFSPLYGAPALLIREVARRSELGWVGMILMAAAFGVLQAGVVDQSLFSTNYLGIESWDAMRRPTLIEPLGISAYMAQLFVAGHVIYSICAPIALIEAFRPLQHHEPWLSNRWLIVVAASYVAVSALVLVEHLTTESSHASILQVLTSLIIVCCLVAGAFRFRRRRQQAGMQRSTITPAVVFVVSVIAASVITAAPETWLGVGFALTVLALSAIGLMFASRSSGWGPRHHVAVAAGALVSRGVLAFTYFPVMGEVAAIPKYVHNCVLLVVVVMVSGLAVWRAGMSASDT